MARSAIPTLRRNLPWLLAAGLSILLLVLAFLQHHWLVQVSEAERVRAHTHLESAAAAFARDFNEPLSRLAFDFLPFFQIPQEEKNLGELLSSRLERWRGTAAEPELLSELWVIGRAGSDASQPELRRLEESRRALVAVEALPAALQELGERIAALPAAAPRDPAISGRPRQLHGGSAGIDALDDQIPALILPLPDQQPDVFTYAGVAPTEAAEREARPLPAGIPPPWRSFRGGNRFLVLVLDREVLTQRILPLLASRHFTSAGFGLQVVAKADPRRVIYALGAPKPAGATIETAAELFGPLVFTRSGRALGRLPAEPPPPPAPPAPPSALEKPTAPEPPAAPEREDRATFPPLSAQLPPVEPPSLPENPPPAAAAAAPEARPAPPRPPFWLSRNEALGSPIEVGEGRWRLEVFHQEGSLDAAIDRAQRRNLGLALGILLVLGVSMLFLAGAARRAQELARRQMELVAGVTHELLTPLAAMKSAGQNLRDGVVQEAPKVARYGELIVKESDRLSGLVGQVLLWAGLSSHEIALRREKISPRELAEAVLEEQRPALETAHFEVELAVPADLPALTADPVALRQALGNLVANAVKYGRPEKGRPFLRLAAQLDQGALVFAVSDHGKGIPAEDLPHLFEPFYRGRKVVASSLAGAGLGLALVRRIAEAHGGAIAVSSNPGRGATFSLTLPISPVGGKEGNDLP